MRPSRSYKSGFGAVCLSLLLLAPACRTNHPGGEESPESKAAVDKLQDLYRLAVGRLPAPLEAANAPAPLTLPLLEQSGVDHFERDGASLRPVFRNGPTGTAHAAALALPAQSDGAFRLTDVDSGLALEAKLLSAASRPGEQADGFVVYRGAYHGADVLHRPTVEGTEDYIWFDARPAIPSVAYHLSLGEKVAGLRLVANNLELMDSSGAPRLRIGAPSVVGADGVRVEASLAVEGCQVDTNPAAPWGRSVTAPQSRECTVHIQWANEQVAYPAVLDPSWTTTGTMVYTHSNHAAVLLPTGKVLVSGGLNSSLCNFAGAELFDPGTRTWGSTSGMIYGRTAHTLTMVGGNALAVGGYNSCNTSALSSAELYNPSTGRWTATSTSLSTARFNHSATLLSDGRLLVAGGEYVYLGSYVYSNAADIYDPGNGRWSSTASLNVARAWHSAVLIGTQVLVAGGVGSNGTNLTSAELFDPSMGASWTATGSLNVAHAYVPAMLLANGNVLVAGGGTTTAELYSPWAGTWSTTGSMTLNVSNFPLLAYGGQVYAPGGNSGAQPQTSVEIYDPNSGAWANGSSLSTARNNHTGTVLASGSLLVAGGYGSAGYLSSSEVMLSPLTCTQATDCASGFCANGYCCNSACNLGPCDRCDLSGSQGLCSITPSGTDGSPTCGAYTCSGSTSQCATSCSGSTQCNTGYYCSGGQCIPREAQGGTCSTNDQCLSNVCATGYCCNQACGPCGVCSQALGSSADGICSPLASGTSGICGTYVCNGTSTSCPTSCTKDGNCITGDYCNAGGQCVPKLSQGTACTASNQCLSGACNDGYCCNVSCTGTCEVCSLGLGATANGTCTMLPKDSAGRSSACAPYSCDGTDPTCATTCATDNDCTNGFCQGGQCFPKRALGVACGAGDQCGSGFCADGVCCNAACGGACQACATTYGATTNGSCVTLPSGRAGSPSCSPYVCSGATTCPNSCTTDTQCIAGDYCNLTSHTCQTKLPLASACTATDMCQSGFCASGVCCNSSCNTACVSCNLQGSAGTCSLDPQGAAGSPSCGKYVCDGTNPNCPTTCTSSLQCPGGTFCNAGACVPLYANGTACTSGNQCQSTFCADGYCCNSACSGNCDVCSAALGASANGLCTPVSGFAGSPSCQPFVCDGTSASCPTRCTKDSQCIGSDYCDASGQCLPRLGNGTTCDRARECTSANCVDGVCCNSACSGACDFCAAALGASADGVCTDVQGAGGAPSCGTYLCQASSASCPSSCTSDSQCVTNAYCGNKQCLSAQANGATCTEARQCSSGNCVDGVCCNSACTDSCDVCSAAKGASADGVCSPAPLGAFGKTLCAPYVCDGTDTTCPTACTADSTCVPGAYCLNGTCVGKLLLGMTCSASNQCQSSQCVDGVCCNSACSGACDACNLPGSMGICATTPLGQQGQPSCGSYVCDGKNTSCPTACATDTQCTQGYGCFQHTCQPKLPLGASCVASNLCASGSCVDGVCCNSACSGGCDVCSAALGASADGTCTVLSKGTQGACGAYVCNGQSDQCPTSCNSDTDCYSTQYCNAAHQCTPHQLNGSSCSSNSQCGSGFCVDGVCCNTACTDECAACNVAPNVGTCSVAPRGPPMGTRPACPGSGTACGGQCDGTHAATCAFPGAAVMCGAPTCDASGASVPAPRCNGQGTCQPAAPVVCSPYVCSDGGCLSACMSDSDCAEGAVCEGGKCSGLKSQGSSCNRNAQCMSGACVDGFCCDSACQGSCSRCNAPGREGTCLPLPAGTAPENGDCAPLVCDGSNMSCPLACMTAKDCVADLECVDGQCVPLKGAGDACQGASDCASGFCVDGVCCDQACDGSCETCAMPGRLGTCALVEGAAAPGRAACNGTGICGGTCDGKNPACSYPTSETTCAPAFCSDGSAVAASTCDGSGQCQPGSATACVAGCAGDHCATPSTVARTGGCASTGLDAGWLCLSALPLLWRRRRKGNKI